MRTGNESRKLQAATEPLGTAGRSARGTGPGPGEVPPASWPGDPQRLLPGTGLALRGSHRDSRPSASSKARDGRVGRGGCGVVGQETPVQPRTAPPGLGPDRAHREVTNPSRTTIADSY